MTQTEPQHRSRHDADPDRVEVRAGEDGDGLFRVRMPVSSTTEARDGDTFTRDRLAGFRDQIEAGDVGVFLDHGRNVETGSRYSALGKVGYWDSPELAERDGVTDLVADAVLADPAEMGSDVGDIREMLAWLKTQAEVGIPLSSSVGWDESTGDRDVPGGADLLEISIVGIPSDPRTTTASAEPAAMARAVSAASDGFDVETFVRAFERETQSRNTVEVGGEEIDLTPPDAVANAATLGLAKDDELEPDCGTGEGRESGQQIAGDSVTDERIDDIAAYLTSHEEDVTAEGPPSDWSDEEWQDCGNLQYALWGGTGTGTGLEWAQSKANAVAEAKGEELPYPERASMDTHNLDDPEFGENDAVEWSSNDVTVRGRVADVGDEFSPAEGVTITGEEGEAVYLIHELDDSLEPPQYRRENVAKPESSLDESQADLPPLEGNFADEDENSMTESDTEPDAESGTDTDEPTLRGMEEKMDEMREMMEENTRMCEEMYEEMVGGGEGEEESEEPEDEAAADADAGEDAERSVTIDDEEVPLSEAREHIAEMRDEAGETSADDAESETENRASEEGETTETAGFGYAGMEE
jgi:hypothetical protein